MKTAPTPLLLRAGPLHLLFDNGMIRSVRYGDIEIVRRVYMALRDQYWNTVPFAIENLSVKQDVASFNLSFDARHDAPGISFSWHGTMEGTVEGVVTIAMHGEAHSGFLRNRIGWCVLHPLTLCKGSPCTLEKYVGTREQVRFPGDAIAPFQPFIGLKGMTYPVEQGVDCTLSFAGDVFETEDQRNWTDASFKTYSTPHSLPIPVEVAAGTRIDQQVTISVSGSREVPEVKIVPAGPDFEKSFLGDGGPPRIGLGYSFKQPLRPGCAEKLALLGMEHLRFDIDPRRDDLDADLSRVASVCEQSGCEAEIALHLSADFKEELADLPELLRACAIPLRRVLVLRKDVTVPPQETINAAIRHLAKFVDKERIAFGTDRHFLEINRAQPISGRYGTLFFSATPQVHTFDDRAVMENLEGLWECITFARTIANGKPVAVSPLTLRPRRDPLRPQKSGGADTRQRELFGAAWMVGALCTGIQAGLRSLTCFSSATGPEGIMSEDGKELFPLYHVFASGIHDAESVGACLITDNGPIIAAIKARMVAGYLLLLANLTDTVAPLTINGLSHGGSIGLLDASTQGHSRNETAFWERIGKPLTVTGSKCTLELQPYAVARIELPL